VHFDYSLLLQAILYEVWKACRGNKFVAAKTVLVYFKTIVKTG